MTDDRVEEVKKNILSPSQWARILYMVFYAVACWVSLIVLPVIIVCQVVISLISGEDNKNLREFGGKLSAYLHNALDYLLYVDETKPWPFESNETDDEADDGPVTYSAPETVSTSASDDTQAGVGSAESAESGESGESADDVFADISFTNDTPASEPEKVGTDELNPATKSGDEVSEAGKSEADEKADEESSKGPL